MAEDSKLYVLKLLVQKLSGKGIDWYEHGDFTKLTSETNAPNQNEESDSNNQESIERLYHENQANSLSLEGNLVTAQGEKVHFAFKINFEQSITEYQKSVEQVEMKDPLIISFTNRAVTLDNTKMNFDLDADGQTESFSNLAKGYGYLAFDRNINGQIDNGQELFGAMKGEGFAQLAKYDYDGNGFIDENDTIFSPFNVWVKNNEQDELISLDRANISAIAMENVETPLNMRQNNELKGAFRQSGLYIDNSEQAGLIQQSDFVV